MKFDEVIQAVLAGKKLIKPAFQEIDHLFKDWVLVEEPKKPEEFYIHKESGAIINSANVTAKPYMATGWIKVREVL